MKYPYRESKKAFKDGGFYYLQHFRNGLDHDMQCAAQCANLSAKLWGMILLAALLLDAILLSYSIHLGAK